MTSLSFVYKGDIPNILPQKIAKWVMVCARTNSLAKDCNSKLINDVILTGVTSNQVKRKIRKTVKRRIFVC